MARVRLATLRDQRDRELARFYARQDGCRFVVELDAENEAFAELQNGRLRLMLNGALCLERIEGNQKSLVFVDEIVARISQGRVRLVYDPSGIEEGHRLKREIARLEEHAVPFAELGAILDASVQPK
jgi:hypothetical protein